jgi:hypothetical protein
MNEKRKLIQNEGKVDKERNEEGRMQKNEKRVHIIT